MLRKFFISGFCLLSTILLCNPTGGIVESGIADINRSGSMVTVDQYTDKAAINWQSFSIDSCETTEFFQPSSESAILNRVVGYNPSEIYGTLKSNGKVFLVNDNGILVGSTGIINTGSFIASTLDLGTNDFLGYGDLSFTDWFSNNSVVNYGSITAFNGDIFLIGGNVENIGSLRAEKGTVGLAGGDFSVTLKKYGKNRLAVNYSVGKVDNRGVIDALKVELRASGDNPYSLAVNNDGIINAVGTFFEDGRILLSADQGIVESSGIVKTDNGSVEMIANNGGVSLDYLSVVETTGDGAITIDGKGESGVRIVNGAKIATVDGDIGITGHGTKKHGIFVEGYDTKISALGWGEVNLYGTADAYFDSNIAVGICDGARISTYYGDINTTGTVYGNYNTIGVSVTDFLTRVESQLGFVYLNGYGNLSNIYIKDAVVKDLLGYKK
jgi:filamentous hemagglutinin family protein